MLDAVKRILRDQLDLPVWTVLVGVGLVSHITLTAVLRKPVTSAWGLLAPLALGMGIEAYEIWVQYRHVGLLTEGNDPLWMILGRHSLDIAMMLALPGLIVAAGQVSSR